MKYVQINSVPHGSTGSVMRSTHEDRLAAGDGSWMVWGRGRAAENSHEFNFGSNAEVCFDVLRTRLDGRAGFHSKRATRRLLAKLDEIDPDVVHLHNLHGYYVNIGMLFAWLAGHRCQVKWTLHDCWAFTGHCAHFTYAHCTQWQTSLGCDETCCQLSEYPKTYSKRSCAKNFEDKRRIFNSVGTDRMEIIVPSRWLAGLVGQSFLARYRVTVKNNRIDRSVFRPTPSDFRKRQGLEGKFVVLGVASPWTKRKGLDDFVRLAGVLDLSEYAVVLVGLSKRQAKKLPDRLMALPRTDSAEKLAGIYSAADVFVHPGLEETFGMTVAEAQACKTPVIVAAGTACAEIVDPAYATVIPSDMSTLAATVVGLREEGRNDAC